MTVLTEGARNAGFIISEANGNRSRDNGEIASGRSLAAGTVLSSDGGTRLVAWTGDEFTDGSEDEVMGILINKTDATVGHQKAAFIARDAEVNINLLTFPAAYQAKMVTQLAKLGIMTLTR